MEAPAASTTCTLPPLFELLHVARPQEYPTANIVVPGHGRPGGRELLEHTLELLAARKLREPIGPRTSKQ